MVGTDIATGTYGSSAPTVGLITSAYGAFGIFEPTGTAAAGLNMMAAGVKGDYDDAVGLDIATTYTAGTMGVISDNNTAPPDGAVAAVLMGGGVRQAANIPNAAFTVIDLNAGAGINFNYGLDLSWTDGAGLTTTYQVADIRGQSLDRIANAAAGLWSITRGSGNFTGLSIESTAFANLGAPANGTQTYCSDCDPTVGVVIACASAGAKTGAMAFRIAGNWDCLSR